MDDSTQVKADLIPYSSEYAGIVRSWIECEETYKLVCRGVNFPPPDEVIDSWQRKGVISFLLISNNKPVGYGELWERKAEHAVELSHILVDTYQRSHGYGTKLLRLLYNRAAQRPGVNKVLINLYNDSAEVLGCYLKAGFELAGTATHIEGLKLVRMVEPE
jgi:ribosomal protein S18 acetylase RimI-like enzyme